MKWLCLCILLLAGCYSQTPQPKPETFIDRYNKNPEVYNAVFLKLYENYELQQRWIHGENE